MLRNCPMLNKNSYILLFILALCTLSVFVSFFQISTFPSQSKKRFLSTQSKILVVNIEGVIQSEVSKDKLSFSDNSSHRALVSLQQAAYTANIKGVLIRINSPGGTVGASQELYNAISRIRKSKKYVAVSIADIGASGGYYTASAANYIFANKGSLVGSIGVIMHGFNLEELFKKVGIEDKTFKSGLYKDIMSYSRESTPVEKEMIQSMLDEVHNQFISDVLAYRKEKITNIDSVSQGQIFTGSQALSLGLIDGLGGEIEALEYLSKKLGIKLTESTVVYEKGSFWERLLSEVGMDSKVTSLLKLLNLLNYKVIL
ncbi:MAG: signal peptide peptidase SppA [Candidatus Margulisiibacteriota bacterium]|nr:MAG: signal peptide peptidase SppA [Candidatus Margulisiibacteriota bacterium]HAR63096.1 signal peptide peptidase SppA [Candidatus Margulisiibacteriota bacterium]HCY38151.1 signal peptide peptidase SppA [Candidatus Margulisiibacteriota bacterium]